LVRLVAFTILALVLPVLPLRAEENSPRTGGHPQPESAQCFGVDPGWCAWPMDLSHPETGWKVVYTSREDGTRVDAMIGTRDGRPRLVVLLSPARGAERGQLIISLRPDDLHPEDWKQYVGRNSNYADGKLHFMLGRRALESVLQAPGSATLYVFVQLDQKKGTVKASHKIPLDGLYEALRYARLGR
jgi:hypothetical protein